MKTFSKDDFNQFEKRFRAQFINSLSGHKSANLIGTSSTCGIENLAIISSVVHLGADPALIGYIARPDTVPRHTLINIRQTRYATLNHVNADIYQQAHQTSARYPKEHSEFQAVGLTPYYHQDFSAPAVLEAKLQLGVKLVREVSIYENSTHFIIMSIEWVRIQQQALGEDGYIDIESLGSLSVSGLDSYHKTQRIKRLEYAKVPSKISQ